jgi:hypothetical protein
MWIERENYFVILRSIYPRDVEGCLCLEWRLERRLFGLLMVPTTVLHFNHVWLNLGDVFIGGLA